VSNQGNRDREQKGNLGQSGKDSANPAGTSGRERTTPGNESWRQGSNDTNRPAGNKPTRSDEDEDSGLGNRTGFR
jgi:hypothetical protein